MPLYQSNGKWSHPKHSRNSVPDRMPCELISSINAALNSRDTVEQARERFAKVANRADEVDRAIGIYTMWLSLGGAK